jgi:hypothetical protein
MTAEGQGTHAACGGRCQMRMILHTAIGLSLVPTIACAATDASPDAEFLGHAAHVAILGCGLFLAGYWAMEAFSRPSVTLGDMPTAAKYMTRSTQYGLGVLTFTAIPMLLYAVVAYLHQQALPIIQPIIPELYKRLEPSIKGEQPSYLLIIVVISAAYFMLLKNESDWNVLLILRNVIQAG